MECLGIEYSKVLSMNLIESLSAMTLTSIVLGITTYSTLELRQYFFKRMALHHEQVGVTHALNLMTRTIHNAGFPSLIKEFPNISTKNTSIHKQAIKVSKKSGLNNSQIGSFVFRKGAASVNDSDALIVSHSSLGHFDCLGQRITPSKVHQQLAHQGYFLQWSYIGSRKTGQLMCQSLTNKGHPQNGGILLGVRYLGIELISHSGHKNMIEINLEMDSGKSYRRVVTLRHD